MNRYRYFLECNGALDDDTMDLLGKTFDRMMERNDVMYVEVDHPDKIAVDVIEYEETIPVMVYHVGHESIDDGSPFYTLIYLPGDLDGVQVGHLSFLLNESFDNAVEEMIHAP